MPAPASSPDERRLAGVLVLLADDHPDSLDALRLILESEGAEVLPAADGEAALQQLRLTVRVPHVVLADLKMPVVDGFELAHRLQREPRWARIPVVAVTGRATMADFHQTLDAGFAARLAKPVEPEELVETIARVLTPATRPRRHPGARRHSRRVR